MQTLQNTSSHLCAEALRCASTGKERDRESNYDYFGARYYDARIGRWGGVEPKMEDYVSYSPFAYSMVSPIKLFDEDGNDPRNGKYGFVNSTESMKNAFNEISNRINLGYEKLFSGDFEGAKNQFIDNVLNSPIVLDLIPSDPTTDFIAPVGLIKLGGKWRLSGLSLQEEAKQITKVINRNRISITYGKLDLISKGNKPHINKLGGGVIEFVPIPHLKPIIYERNPITKEIFPRAKSNLTREATLRDLEKAVERINIFEEMRKITSSW